MASLDNENMVVLTKVEAEEIQDTLNKLGAHAQLLQDVGYRLAKAIGYDTDNIPTLSVLGLCEEVEEQLWRLSELEK